MRKQDRPLTTNEQETIDIVDQLRKKIWNLSNPQIACVNQADREAISDALDHLENVRTCLADIGKADPVE